MALKEFKDDIRTRIPANGSFKSNAPDNVLKWLPLASLFVLDMAGVKMKHTAKQHLLITSITEALVNAMVRPLKKIIKRRRPFPSVRENSFPSGHAASSFAGAGILHQELKDNHPALSYSGYVMAAAASIRRVNDHKHFFSDVVTGAAIGIISTHLGYWLLFKKDNDSRK
jgi:membrane-associated phospholipid phosphatase